MRVYRKTLAELAEMTPPDPHKTWTFAAIKDQLIREGFDPSLPTVAYAEPDDQEQAVYYFKQSEKITWEKYPTMRKVRRAMVRMERRENAKAAATEDVSGPESSAGVDTQQ